MFRKQTVTMLLVALFLSLAAGSSPAANAVLLDVAADMPVVEAGKTQRIVVRALVRPGTTVTRRDRAPLAVALVLDKSGSMRSDNKIANARRGAIEALKALDGRDVASVVAYDTSASLLLPARSVSSMDPFAKIISTINADGSTALYDGVQLGAKQLQPYIKEGYVPRIIMLSDGMANVGPASTSELAALGRALSEREMTITTIGLGLDYNEDLMTALAAESGGNSYFAKSAESLVDIFARDMADAVTLTARRVHLTVECGDGVMPIRVIGRGGEQKGRTLEAPIDNLYGAEKYALFEVELPERKSDTNLEALTVRLDYVDALSGKNVTERMPFTVAYSGDSNLVKKNRQMAIVSQIELAKNAEVREEVLRLADEGHAREAAKLLKERTDDLKMAVPAAGAAAPTIAAEAESFEELAKDLESSGSMTPEQRKKAKNEAYTIKNQQSSVD